MNVDDFTEQRDCYFEGELYSVRDNGAILRHSRENKRKRMNDDVWTFGKENNQNPYLLFCGVRVHRIVATAFHGDPPNPLYVIDHIDTNCRNNRPENLRWVTRLENALNNPITRKKIEYLCGSVEAFLKNPTMLQKTKLDSNIDWMRTVTKEEAQNCLVRMELWAKTGRSESNLELKEASKINVFEDIYKPVPRWQAGLDREPGLDLTKTPWCAQYMWRSNKPEYFQFEPRKMLEFPCAPKHLSADFMDMYLNSIQRGKVFAFNVNDIFPKLYAYKTIILHEKKSFLVICTRDDSIWNVIGIELNDKNHFIHFNLGAFSTLEEAEKYAYSIKNEEEFWRKGYSCKWYPDEIMPWEKKKCDRIKKGDNK